jgi:hypothetical protein
MVWKGSQHDLADSFLARHIGLGHQVGGAFFAYCKTASPVEQHVAGGPGRLFTNHCKILHYIQSTNDRYVPES